MTTLPLKKTNRITLIAGITAAILLIPFVAMQFTAEVNWNIGDFLIGGILLFGTGLLIDRVVRKTKQPSRRLLLVVAIVIALSLIWTELAVGIFGTPFAGS